TLVYCKHTRPQRPYSFPTRRSSDLAFPEIFTELALAGANLVAIPSAVPVGFEHLLALRTRARAQDNQLFVAAANLVGFDGETQRSAAHTSELQSPYDLV